MKKHMIRAVAALAAIALAGAASAQDTIKIKIGAASATDHAPVFAGVERGIFAEHGLDAEVVMYQSGVDMVNGLLNGAQDVNVMGSVPFLSGIARGFPLVLIGHLHGDPNRTDYSDNHSIVASAASGVTEDGVAALKGKTIGLPRGTGAEGYLLGVLGEASLTQDDVTLVNVAPADLVTALNQGDVDAVAIWEPWGSTAVTKVDGAVRVKQGGCPSCYDPGTILTTKSVIAEKPDALTRFMSAFAEAQQWVRQNNDEAAEINMRWIQGVDLDTMRLALGASHLDPRMSKLTAEMYQEKSLPFLVSLGRVESVFDPSDSIDNTFMKKAIEDNPDAFSDLPEIPAERQLD